jgi:energy-coupling factor transport system ATP-binding protein
MSPISVVLNRLSFSYPLADSPVLKDVSLSIQSGDLVLVAGKSGAGKSTLLRTLNGLVPHFTGGRLSGSLRVDGLDPITTGPHGMSTRVGFVQQEPESQFVVDTVEDELAFGLENHGVPDHLIARRIQHILSDLDLGHLRLRPIHSLSGGEQQRVAIAAAIALQPPILVLDEPTSQLDPQSAEDTLSAVRHLNQDLGLTTILSEHRLERVLPYTDQLVFLPERAKAPLSGPVQQVLPKMPFAPPLVRLARELGWTPLPLTVGDALPRIAAMSLHAGNPHGGHRAIGPVCVAVQDVSFAYGAVPALSSVNLEIREGEVVTLMGRNGTGKTTLLKLLVGLLRPQPGRVTVGGLDTQRHDVVEIIQRVGFVPQDPGSLLFSDTVRQELEFTCAAHHMSAAAVDASLAALGLQDLADRYPRELSVGERQRVAVAAIMVAEPRILLLDEPTRGMDWPEKEALATFLRRLAAEGRAVVIATHDVELAARCADRAVVLEGGRVLADGPVGIVMQQVPLFASQMLRLFGNPHMVTVDDVLEALRS